MAVTSADRAAELNRLIVEQATVTRSMAYGKFKPTEEQQAVINARADRMHELVELLDLPRKADLTKNMHAQSAGEYLNDRIAAWLKANPLAATTQQIADLIESQQRPDCGVSSGVVVSIGDLTKGGYYYAVTAADVSWPHQLEIKVPESVAEHFRQQGRRQLQSELRTLLNVSRA